MPLLTESELRERVERLAAIDRPSASPGERAAAELIAAAVADDLRIGPRALRRLLPKRTTSNVVAEVTGSDPRRTVIVVSHHDAAHSGLVFHPELPRSIARRFPRLLERTNTTPPTLWTAAAGPALVGLGAVLGARGVRRAGTLLSLGNALAMADIGARDVVPGANDNLSGVAALLSLAHSLRDAPIDGMRVILLSTGSEESFSEGMEAFARRHLRSLPKTSTHVICLDAVGSPHLLLLEGEGMLGIREYPKEFLRVIRECADELGVFLWPNLRFRNATDGLTALRLGFITAMIGSVDRYKLPSNYHWPTDTADNVRYDTIADAARVCVAVIERLGQPSKTSRM